MPSLSKPDSLTTGEIAEIGETFAHWHRESPGWSGWSAKTFVEKDGGVPPFRYVRAERGDGSGLAFLISRDEGELHISDCDTGRPSKIPSIAAALEVVRRASLGDRLAA